MTSPSNDRVLLAGLSLDQYAGVTAALAESFELGPVLAQEQIDKAVWERASREWAEAIVLAPDLQVELIQKRRIAEDCLARALPPLDDDPAAWTGLLGALAASSSPAMITEALDISMSDIARLGRAWNRKMQADPDLAKRVVELAPTAVPPSRIDAAARALRPFPWTPEGRTASQLMAKERDESEDAMMNLLHLPIEKAPARHLASFQLKDQSAARAPEVASSPPLVTSAPSQVAHREASPSAPVAPAQMATPVVIAHAAAEAGRSAPPVGQVTAWAPADAASKPATPFEALDQGALGMSLLRYAELCTLVQDPKADVPALLSSFQIDKESFRAIEEHYNKKFSREARWAMEFARLVTQAQKALRERRVEARAPAQSAKTTAPFPTPARPEPLKSESRDGAKAPLNHGEAATPPRAHAPELSMEQYAWVTATLRKTPPEKLHEVLARLRLTPETRELLDAAWAARMAREPGLSETLGAAVKRHLFAAAPASSGAGTTPPAAPTVENPPRESVPPQRAPNRLQRTEMASHEHARLPITPFNAPKGSGK